MSVTAGTTLVIKSPKFLDNEFISSKYTCDGLNVNPEISIDEIPKNTKSLAIILDDPDAPNGSFCHWIMWNITPKNSIKENSAPGIQGRNSFGENKYDGPCPPSGKHHYHFKVYALNTKLNLLVSTDKNELEKAMKEHIIARGELVGLYKR
ncbi:YbhB/YbcL family Raf kinase inhibitor-like protein [Flavobacterium sp. LB3P45]|uniref:YbhB/YbcL family Raf kinase inhibitor-like protein n=1 Tax=Flavobacterium fructosi TaxID=3230416 RepID=A0ABW6HPX0_9FLAO